MKRSLSSIRSSQRSGFTLVELLVVMGIIAILAGVLFPAASAAIKAAQCAKANSMASQIQTAVIAYNTEYSVYPVATAVGTPADTYIADDGGANWAVLDQVLCGNIRPSTGVAITAPAAGPTNNRGIAFLNLKSGDVFPAGSSTGTQDAPKNPLPSGTHVSFNIAMDSDYSGVVGDTAPANVMPNLANSTTGTNIPQTGGTSTAGVAIWANCNGTASSQNWSSSFYVKTY